MKPARVVVADDEPLSLSGLVELLAADPDVAVVASCTTGVTAAEAIRSFAAEIAILDIRMPGLSGLEVAAIESASLAAIVFITAHDRFALDAFDVSAVDYVMKPFTDERFQAALARAKQRVVERRALAEAGEGDPAAAQLVVREAGKTRVVPVADIDWIEGADYCVRVLHRGRSLLVRESLASLARRLPADTFLRIHRSVIVNMSRIKELRSNGRDDYVAVLADGTRLRLSRSRRRALERALARVRRGGV